ncbi:MAG: DUF6089 family protein [Bacteroidia bacterium]|nr:DUF6089 family protein [Bacteroidia bacterium]MDW8089430.1 DUF6089 family protein [Bacteroidia bacterium]
MRAWVIGLLVGLGAAQRAYRSYLSAGPSVGITNYKGDLDDDFTIKFTRPGFGINLFYNFHPHLRVRLTFTQGWIGAADSMSTNRFRKWRNLHFRSHITEFSLQLTYDFFASPRIYRFRPAFTPFIFAGIGVFNFDPRAKGPDGRWYRLQPLGTEGQYLNDPTRDYPKPYALTQICIPMGIGARWRLSTRWDLLFEIGLRKTFTDYLDDVSDRYPPPDLMLAQMGPIAAALSDRSGYRDQGSSGFAANDIRGFANQKDWYVYTGFTLLYIIDPGERCPKFR